MRRPPLFRRSCILDEGSQLATGTLCPPTIHFVFGSLLVIIGVICMGIGHIWLWLQEEVGLIQKGGGKKYKLHAFSSCESSVHSYKNELHCGIGSNAAEEWCRIVCPSAKREWEAANARRSWYTASPTDKTSTTCLPKLTIWHS